MGVVITPSGEHKRLKPQEGEVFSLWEISEILDGIVDIAFIGNKWIFINKLAHKRQFPYNETASLIFNYPIAGLCIVLNEEELPPQFLIPDKIKEVENYLHENNDETYLKNDSFKKMEKDKTSGDNSKMKEDTLKEAYYLLFETGKDIDEIPNNFIIYRKGNKVIDLSNDIDKQMHLLNELMNFYLELEEYEKCSNISKLIDYLQ